MGEWAGSEEVGFESEGRWGRGGGRRHPHPEGGYGERDLLIWGLFMRSEKGDGWMGGWVGTDEDEAGVGRI